MDQYVNLIGALLNLVEGVRGVSLDILQEVCMVSVIVLLLSFLPLRLRNGLQHCCISKCPTDGI